MLRANTCTCSHVVGCKFSDSRGSAEWRSNLKDFIIDNKKEDNEKDNEEGEVGGQ